MYIAFVFAFTLVLIVGDGVRGQCETVQTGVLPDLSQCVKAPKECPNKNITFWLYTRSTANNPFELNGDNIKSAPYAKGAPFELIIHGYKESKDSTPNLELRAALFQLGEFNVISVDWSPLTKAFMLECYPSAAYNVKTVANCTARQILHMMDSMPDIVNRDNLHIIGFSLGAQAAGIIGYYFKKLANTTAKWMTGLEPAGPLFEFVPVSPDDRLSPDDAEFLDVYHTNAGNRGVVFPVGKVDFYMNNGYKQPGCETISDCNCNHYRAVFYYSESINPNSKGFWGAQCTINIYNYLLSLDICEAAKGSPTTQLSGYHMPHTAQGTYQVKTNSSAPFALGKYTN